MSNQTQEKFKTVELILKDENKTKGDESFYHNAFTNATYLISGNFIIVSEEKETGTSVSSIFDLKLVKSLKTTK